MWAAGVYQNVAISDKPTLSYTRPSPPRSMLCLSLLHLRLGVGLFQLRAQLLRERVVVLIVLPAVLPHRRVLRVLLRRRPLLLLKLLELVVLLRARAGGQRRVRRFSGRGPREGRRRTSSASALTSGFSAAGGAALSAMLCWCQRFCRTRSRAVVQPLPGLFRKIPRRGRLKRKRKRTSCPINFFTVVPDIVVQPLLRARPAPRQRSHGCAVRLAFVSAPPVCARWETSRSRST